MEYFFYSCLLPFLLGAIFIGAATERTIMVYEGKILATGLLAAIVSASVYFNISYVVNGELVEFLSFSVGTWIVTCLLAFRRKRMREKSEALEATIREDLGA